MACFPAWWVGGAVTEVFGGVSRGSGALGNVEKSRTEKGIICSVPRGVPRSIY